MRRRPKDFGRMVISGSILIGILALMAPDANAALNAPAAMQVDRTGYFQAAPGKPTLAPFSTDVCTHFPNGTKQEPMLWAHCCVVHDLSYWVGGSYAERLRADDGLRSCVSDTGHPEIAEAMFAGVRVGGSPYYKTPWRWGYGWNQLRGYKTLTLEEKSQLDALQPQI